MFWNLLSASNSSGAGEQGGGSGRLIFLAIMIIIFVLFMIWSRQSQKKREEEINGKLNAIQPGDKVMTIGYLCGTVVEVCPEDNTLVLETGSETAGKSYIKIDRKAVFQTNAAKEEAPVEEIPVEETEEPVFEEEMSVVTEENVEETLDMEENAEEPTEE